MRQSWPLSLAIVGVLAIPSAADARTHEVSMGVSNAHPSRVAGVDYVGTITGDPIGRGRIDLRSRSKGRRLLFTIRTRRGRLTGEADVTRMNGSGGLSQFRGRWKITGGTGRYAGARGSGRTSGNESAGELMTQTFFGSVSY